MAERTEADERADQLLRDLLNDGKVGPAVRAKAKEMFPGTTFVEDKFDPIVNELRGQLDQTNAALEAIRAERAAERATADEASAKQRMEGAIESARKAYGLTTEDGFNAMVEHMRETGNYTDAMGAAAYVASMAPKPPPPTPTFGAQHMNLFGSRADTGLEGLKFLHTDPLGFQDHQLAEFVKDPQGFVDGTVGY